MLWRRWGNVLTTLESDVVTTSETYVGTTLIFDRVTTWQRQQRRCDNVVTTSLCQLGMDTSELWIERAHQVGEKKRGQERQIVVQFNSYKNKLDILRNCKKLKGTNFSIFEDFSKETASIRKEKWKEVLKNRKDGKISYLQYKTVICKEWPQVS